MTNINDIDNRNGSVEEISMNYQGKVPPNAPEAERAVLGAMMLGTDAIAQVLEVINSESFYNLQNKRIFETMTIMFGQRKPVDMITLTDELIKTGEHDKLGGDAYILELNNAAFSADNVEYHARIIQERFLKRELIKTAGAIVHTCYDETADVFEEIDKAESRIFEIAEKKMSNNIVDLNRASKEVYEDLAAIMGTNNNGITGVPTGYHELDKLTAGFQKGDLIIVAARPSMGKTALALSIARNMAVKYERPIAFFSLEMGYKAVTQRLLSAEAKVDLKKIRSGDVNPEENQHIVNGIGTLSNSHFYIDDDAMISVLEIRAKARRLQAEHNIQAVFVDYLQFINPPKAESRQREISIISSHLKQLAKELNIPVIALAQLNRAVEQRTGDKGKRPMLSDLRESGSIEQDADVVMLLHRAEYYKIETYEDGTSTENTADIIIAKQRNGPTGDIRVGFEKRFARFENLAFGMDVPPEIQAMQSRDEEKASRANAAQYQQGYGSGAGLTETISGAHGDDDAPF